MNVACWIPLASTYIEDLIAVCSSKPADAKILASACALYPFSDIYSLQLIHFGLFEYVGTDCHSHRFDVETSTYHKACHLRWLCVVQALATSRGLYVQSRKIPHMLDRSSQRCLYILTIPSMKAASTSMDQTSFDEHSSLTFSFYLLFFHSRHASCDTSSRVLEADRLYTGGCFGNDVVDLFLLSIRRGITGNTIEECLIIFRKKDGEKERYILLLSMWSFIGYRGVHTHAVSFNLNCRCPRNIKKRLWDHHCKDGGLWKYKWCSTPRTPWAKLAQRTCFY